MFRVQCHRRRLRCSRFHHGHECAAGRTRRHVIGSSTDDRATLVRTNSRKPITTRLGRSLPCARWVLPGWGCRGHQMGGNLFPDPRSGKRQMCDQNSIYERIKADSEKETVRFTQLCGSLMCDSLIWFQTEHSMGHGTRTLLVAGCDPSAPHHCSPTRQVRPPTTGHVRGRNFSPRPFFQPTGPNWHSYCFRSLSHCVCRLSRALPAKLHKGVCLGLTASGANTK